MAYFLLIIIAILAIVGYYVQRKLKQTAVSLSKVELKSGLTGQVAAEKMIHENNLDSRIYETKGFLDDHYNPLLNTVNLSGIVYHGRSPLAVAVACHEVGHALQWKRRWKIIGYRMMLVPFVKIVNDSQQYLLLVAFLFFKAYPNLLLLSIIAFTVSAAFALITLPIEYDASIQGYKFLLKEGIIHEDERMYVKRALGLAALTYTIHSLSSLTMLGYLIVRKVSPI